MKHIRGKRILLTRTIEQNIHTAKLIEKEGAIPILFPCIHIDFLEKNIQQTLSEIHKSKQQNTDIIFSSSNGVKAVAACVKNLKDTFEDSRIIAVGNKTAQTLTNLGCPASIVPEQASQQGLIHVYEQQTLLPDRVYFFRAEEGGDVLLRHLKQYSVHTLLIPSYRARCYAQNSDSVSMQLQKNTIDAVLLGSAKTAAFYVQRLANLTLANAPTIAVMSPQVEKAADKLGLKVQVIAKKPSFKAMLQGLDDYFTTH